MEKPKHILVIRLSAMGDVAMVVPVLRTLVATYPELKVTVLTRKFFFPIFKDINNINLYAADVEGLHKGIFGLSRLARELKELEIDAVADLHDVLRTNVLRSIFYFFGIPVKQINKGRAEKKALTDPEDSFFEPVKSTHQRYADVFAELDLQIDLQNHSFPKKKQVLSSKVKEITGNSDKKWLGTAPFAQYKTKTYPQELMLKVIDALESHPNLEIFLFGGGKDEISVLENIANKFSKVRNVAGKLSFEEELALISNMDAMLSMDSGNAHLAAMFGLPVVTLWGVTHPYAGFMPFNQPMSNALLPDLTKYDKIPTSIYGNKAPEGYEEVMHSIPPEKVVAKVLEVLIP